MTEPFKQQELHPTVLEGIAKDSYWGYEHPKYCIDDWLLEVGEEATYQSYHQWISSRLEEEEHETTMCKL
jgi:hypothetical protein